MNWLQLIDTSVVLTFTLLLARTSGLVVTAPIFGGSELPMQFRGLLAFTLAMLILPSQYGLNPPDPGSIPLYAISIGSELMIGITMGIGIQLFFTGMQSAGEVIGRVGGMMLADVFDPAMGTSVPLFSRFLNLVAMALFVLIGGHRLVIAGLLDTLVTIPLGSMAYPPSIGETIVDIVTVSFTLGFRVAAPMVAALLLATVVLGLVGRTLPQLNIMALGFGLNSVLTFILVCIGLGSGAWLFCDHIAPVMEQLFNALSVPIHDELLTG